MISSQPKSKISLLDIMQPVTVVISPAPPLPHLPLAHDNDSEDDADELPPPPLNPMNEEHFAVISDVSGGEEHSNNERELAIMLA